MDCAILLAPLGEVLRTMLPLAAEVRRTVYYRITDLGRDVLATAMDGDAGQGGRTNAGPSTRSPAAADELAQDGSLLKSANDRPLRRATTGKRRGKLSGEDQDMERRVLERLAKGDPVKVSTLRTATAASLPLLAGDGAKEMDRARDRSR